MSPRRITALVCVAAIVLLLLGAFSRRWLVADLRRDDMNGALRIGLTGVSACIATAEVTQCERIEWAQLQSQFGGRIEGGSWMWLGRLTFGLSILTALVLAALAVIAAANLDLRMPVSPARVATWCCLALFPFMFGYWILTPGVFSSIAAGRGFALVAAGAILGLVAAYRETTDRLD